MTDEQYFAQQQASERIKAMVQVEEAMYLVKSALARMYNETPAIHPSRAIIDRMRRLAHADLDEGQGDGTLWSLMYLLPVLTAPNGK